YQPYRPPAREELRKEWEETSSKYYEAGPREKVRIMQGYIASHPEGPYTKTAEKLLEKAEKEVREEADRESFQVVKERAKTLGPFEAIALWNEFLEGREGPLAEEGAGLRDELRTQGMEPGLSRSDTAGVYVSEKDGAELVRIEGGRFERGLTESLKKILTTRYYWTSTEAKRAVADEGDAAEIKMDGFYLYRFLNARGSAKDREGRPFIRSDPQGLTLVHDQWRPAAGKEKHPVVCVSWHGAKAYAAWAGGDLPSEAQWEMAASWDPVAGEKRLFPWGDVYRKDAVVCADHWLRKEILNAIDLLDFQELRENNPVIHPRPVHSFPDGISPWGCYHMAGNVAEWCADVYDKEFYKSRNSEFPNPVRGGAGSLRVARGGHWKNICRDTRTTNRLGLKPTTLTDDLGFRVMLESR
ncbi:MAG: formylglycine-generating enzyme family protein, partial [Planctomycetota bacterium]